MKILIFSGTTEGRQLSEMLSEGKKEHFLCVASDYGSEVMSDRSHVTVHVGRMDSDEMCRYMEANDFGEGDIIADATHPYAVEVSENIAEAARKMRCELIRVKRDESKAGIIDSYVNQYDSMEEFAARTGSFSGNILLTTGSRDLEKYCASVSEETMERTYVRIIPAKESIETCNALGIISARIIAMQGPFSRELNSAILRQYDIRHMLTKDSGTTGGFFEKAEAASELGVTVHVLKRPAVGISEGGLSLIDAYEKITGNRYEPRRRIILAGTGPGGSGSITEDVKDEISAADAIFGAATVTDKVLGSAVRYDMYRAEDIIGVLEGASDIRNAVILFSGDSGFFSGARKCAAKLGEHFRDADITVLPGISSVSYLAAKMRESHDDARIISLHGRNSLHNIGILADSVRHNRKTFALMSDDGDVRECAKILKELGISAKITVGCDLGGDTSEGTANKKESIRTLSVDEALSFSGSGSITVLFINDTPERKRLINRLRDDDLTRGSVPMTKECVRHESIGRLDLKEGDVVYDIGGGTGSVALEIASVDPSLHVTTIEKKKEACELIRENIKKLGLLNVTVIEGNAEDALKDMDAPDCVFIGGSGGKMSEIISVLMKKRRNIRYVINAVSIETISEVSGLIADLGAGDVRAVQLSVSDIGNVGGHQMFKAQNPVTVFSFTL